MNSLECVSIYGSESSVVRGSFGRHSFPMHSHNDFAVCVVSSGLQGFTEGRNSAILHKSCFAAVNPGQMHNGFNVDSDGWNQFVLFFGRETAKTFAEENEIRASFCFNRSVVSNPDFAETVTEKISSISFADDPLHRQCLFEEVVALLHHKEKILVPAVKIRHRKAVITAMEMMQDAPADKHGLDTLASLAGMSKFHFLRSFKEYCGITPHAYLNQLRLDKAFRMLKDTDKTSAEIASECGFSDQPHFLRSFKKLWGTTPNRIIKK